MIQSESKSYSKKIRKEISYIIRRIRGGGLFRFLRICTSTQLAGNHLRRQNLWNTLFRVHLRGDLECSKLGERLMELAENERWIIVEGLVESYYELQDMGEDETAQKHADLLDKLSPNWRDAMTCREIEINKISVDSNQRNGDE